MKKQSLNVTTIETSCLDSWSLVNATNSSILSATV